MAEVPEDSSNLSLADGVDGFEQLINEMAHLSIEDPIDRFDCVLVTISKLIKTGVTDLAFNVSVPRPLPKTTGVSLDTIQTILHDLGREIGPGYIPIPFSVSRLSRAPEFSEPRT